MKIRTDFVTNSSSSSFTVTLEIETRDGLTLTKHYGNDDPEFESDVSVFGSAKVILKATTVGELMEALDITGEEDEYEDEEWYEDEEDGEETEGIRGNEDAKLKSATIKRFWSAAGEWSSSFGYNVDKFLPDLKKLCRNVLDTDGEAKEQAKEKLKAYLDNVGELVIVSGSGYWPSNMCGGNGTNKVSWEGLTNKIEILAEMVVNDELPASSDRAEEIVRFDFDRKKIEASNIYYLE